MMDLGREGGVTMPHWDIHDSQRIRGCFTEWIGFFVYFLSLVDNMLLDWNCRNSREDNCKISNIKSYLNEKHMSCLCSLKLLVGGLYLGHSTFMVQGKGQLNLAMAITLLLSWGIVTSYIPWAKVGHVSKWNINWVWGRECPFPQGSTAGHVVVSGMSPWRGANNWEQLNLLPLTGTPNSSASEALLNLALLPPCSVTLSTQWCGLSWMLLQAWPQISWGKCGSFRKAMKLSRWSWNWTV